MIMVSITNSIDYTIFQNINFNFSKSIGFNSGISKVKINNKYKR